MELYEMLCNRMYGMLKSRLNDTFVDVCYKEWSDSISVYVRHGDLKFELTFRNVSRDIIMGRADARAYVREFIVKYKDFVLNRYFKL